MRFRDGLDGGPGHGDGGVPAQVRQRGDDAGGESETGGGEDISAIAAVFVRGGSRRPPGIRPTVLAGQTARTTRWFGEKEREQPARPNIPGAEGHSKTENDPQGPFDAIGIG